MAYVYQVCFDIRPDQVETLVVGASLQRVVGYLRTLLPAQDGYISSRAMNSVEAAPKTLIVVESAWEDWDDVVAHRESRLAEDKILVEFGNGILDGALSVRIYEEIG